jgi:hypothetical protein
VEALKEFTLDYKTWRSGGDDSNPNALGEGLTRLRNKHGYMCCLGQYCIQAGVSPNELTGQAEPGDLGLEVPGINYARGFDTEIFYNTSFAREAMNINDDENRTPEERLTALKELFEKHGIKFQVINLPKGIQL